MRGLAGLIALAPGQAVACALELVLAMDVSRLTRSSPDWHRLLESCALTDTLLFVEERLYGPGDLSDRLVFGCHGATAGARRRGGLREVSA